MPLIDAAMKGIDCAGGRVSSRAANTAAGDSRPPDWINTFICRSFKAAVDAAPRRRGSIVIGVPEDVAAVKRMMRRGDAPDAIVCGYLAGGSPESATLRDEANVR